MSASDEGVHRGDSGALRPEDDPIGLVWLKGCQRVASYGLEKALGTAARLHKGQDAPAGGAPSVVVCFASVEEDLASQVESARALARNSVVLVFVPKPNLRLARAALEGGAGGLLHAAMSPEQILRALRVTLEGETVLPRCLLSEWSEEQRPPDLAALLSHRQREILGLAAEGLTNAEIARRVYLSESTVKQHLRSAYKALDARNRREATAIARGCA